MINERHLRNKIRLAKVYIREFYEAMEGKVYISFSGGKDSTVLRHLILSMYPDIPVVFCDTTNETDDILNYVKLHVGTIWMLPKQGFLSIIKSHGFPLVSKVVARKLKDLKNPTPNNVKSRANWLNDDSAFRLTKKWRFLVDQDFDITTKCCDVLKKEPFRRYEKETGRKPFTGVMMEESQQRKSKILSSGVNIYEGKNIKSSPLAFFTESDVWAYAELHDIRFAENYYDRTVNGKFIEADKRSGCEYCFMGYQFEVNKPQNRLSKSKILNPKRFAQMMKVKHNGVSMKRAITKTFYIGDTK